MASSERGNGGSTALFWVLAIALTLAAVVYQRLIGPTRPARGRVTVESSEIRYNLARSHGGSDDHLVAIQTPDESLSGYILYKRYKTADPWSRQEMVLGDGCLVGSLPHQPTAGKLVYRVYLCGSGDPVALPPSGPTVIRFRGGVPGAVLIPHVILIFLAMLWSNRAGIEALRSRGDPRRLALWTLGLLILGGLVCGPAVQWYSFGKAWTGFPYGHDLTDNKTLIAVLAWIAAVIISRRSRRYARAWVLGAAIVTLIVFSIPHSVLGTELDYSQLPEVPPPSGH
ncbi:MAG: hypothetical protein KAY24_02725 [Candidatus Eisenbacteria sp.]|nr:hypothetical protein [Candidatus Eisenbacteria bacterium]